MRISYRLEVEACDACPFMTVDVQDDQPFCWHPAHEDSRVLDASGDEIGAPPAWCPMRGGDTLVVGPRATEKTDSEESSK